MSEAFDIAEFIEKNKARISEVHVAHSVGDITTTTCVLMETPEHSDDTHIVLNVSGDPIAFKNCTSKIVDALKRRS